MAGAYKEIQHAKFYYEKTFYKTYQWTLEEVH